MKKYFAWLLTLCVVLAFAGCSSPDRTAGVQLISSQGSLSLPNEPENPETPDGNQSVALEQPPEESSTPMQATEPEENSQSLGTSSEPETSGSVVQSSEPESLSSSTAQPESSSSAAQSGGQEMRAVWFSYLDFASLLTGQSKSGFSANIGEAFDNVAGLGLNTVIVQVRPFGDALYPSEIFPWSHVVTGTEGKDPGFDPLEIMVEEAHSRGLKIEAWVNPYRVRISNIKAPLADENPAQQYLNTGSDMAVEFQGGIYYNPAREETVRRVVDGVREIVANYDVDGIHFDDYFYPNPDEDFDKKAYDQYKQEGGLSTLANWRRENVNELISRVYQAVKAEDPTVRFGVSPQGNFENNYDKQYIDVAKWLSEDGYVDYICPQIYFGFENSTYPFAATVERWNRQIKVQSVQLYVGLSPYKIGLEDQWAGDGRLEWQQDSDILARMVETARKAKCYGGFAMFRYDSIFYPAAGVKDQVENELKSLQDVL